MKRPASPGVITKEIDNLIKIYTSKQPAHSTPNLLLSCRGWYEQGAHNSPDEAPSFILPAWASLFFYAPSGSVLHCSNLKLMKGEYLPIELRMPGEKVIDYQLEHFSEIEWANEKAYKDLFVKSRVPKYTNPDRHPSRFYDILSLEPSRRSFRVMTLHEVINLLYESGYQYYSRIHCSFDRTAVQSGVRPSLFEPGKWHQS